MPKVSANIYSGIVYPGFTDREESINIPGGYITPNQDLQGFFTVRKALEFVRDKKLIYRVRLPTHADQPRGDNPMIKTMQFKPWTSLFTVRRLPITADELTGYQLQRLLNPRLLPNKPMPRTSQQWMTYFCFSDEVDCMMFKMAWT